MTNMKTMTNIQDAIKNIKKDAAAGVVVVGTTETMVMEDMEQVMVDRETAVDVMEAVAVD